MRRILVPLLALVLAVPATARAAAPDDPYYSAQWGLHAIRAVRSWQVTQGAGSVVAVVDTGVDRAHPDLRGRLLPGRDFVDDDDDPSDENGHGTLIAGIIAAATDNGIGVAAVAPGVKILPVRVLDDDGNGSSSDVRAGVRWALDQGADVVNLSLAQDEAGDVVLLRDPSVDLAIREAASRGATVVIAAGNDPDGGSARTAYDATVDGVLVVGGSTKDDRRAAYSNFGDGLDLLAPGGGSAKDPSDDGCSQSNAIVSTWWSPSSERSTYGGGCGTSMAVGFVSGVAAMLHTRGYDNAGAVRRILRTADDIGAPGHDAETGHGRLNAARALGAKRAAAKPSATPTGSRPRPTPTGDVRSQGSPKPAGTPTERPSPRETAPPPATSVAVPPKPPAGDPSERRPFVVLATSLLAAVVLGHYARALGALRRR